MIIKTGEVYWRNEEGVLYICESFQDTKTGKVTSTMTPVKEEPNAVHD